MGKSTFELAMFMMKWLPLWLVDKLLLVFGWLILGNIETYGLRRPKIGPLELKNTQGKTPVLDIGALAKIRSGEIKVVPGIKRFTCDSVELVNGEHMAFDSVIFATGYRSNVPSWLKVRDQILCFPLFSFVFPPKRLRNKSTNVILIDITNRKLNSSTKRDSQRHHSRMAGKEREDCMQLGSQGEASLGLRLML